MFFVYKGLGFLVPLFMIAGAIIGSSIDDKTIFPIGAVLCLIVGYILKGKRGVKTDTFFFIPMIYWAAILAVVGVFYIFVL